MIKATLKDLLGSAAKRLPWGAREALFLTLCERMGPGVALSRIAHQVGLTGFLADGDCGVIQSSAADCMGLSRYARTGTHATRALELLQQLFGAAGGTYLDIGANIGLTTIPIARNRSVRCGAFEPEPANFANLRENVRRNVMHDNVDSRCMALFDRAATLPFGLANDGNLGDHPVLATVATARRVIDVPAMPLDALDLPLGGVLGVKIDTQGAEPFVLAGGRNTLAGASVCAIEFAPLLDGAAWGRSRHRHRLHRQLSLGSRSAGRQRRGARIRAIVGGLPQAVEFRSSTTSQRG